ncbi:MAG TPA: hypothetical protein PLV92_07035 [Pirellulaceae bacterium]|nr:hypothetical protein [Pirellulaceae bacterium]
MNKMFGRDALAFVSAFASPFACESSRAAGSAAFTDDAAPLATRTASDVTNARNTTTALTPCPATRLTRTHIVFAPEFRSAFGFAYFVNRSIK